MVIKIDNWVLKFSKKLGNEVKEYIVEQLEKTVNDVNESNRIPGNGEKLAEMLNNTLDDALEKIEKQVINTFDWFKVPNVKEVIKMQLVTPMKKIARELGKAIDNKKVDGLQIFIDKKITKNLNNITENLGFINTHYKDLMVMAGWQGDGELKPKERKKKINSVMEFRKTYIDSKNTNSLGEIHPVKLFNDVIKNVKTDAKSIKDQASWHGNAILPILNLSFNNNPWLINENSTITCKDIQSDEIKTYKTSTYTTNHQFLMVEKMKKMDSNILNEIEKEENMDSKEAPFDSCEKR